MNQATEIYSREFDSIFFSLPRSLQDRLETRIREMGRRLQDFPHHRLQGRSEFRLRVGDYRIIYVHGRCRQCPTRFSFGVLSLVGCQRAWMVIGLVLLTWLVFFAYCEREFKNKAEIQLKS